MYDGCFGDCAFALYFNRVLQVRCGGRDQQRTERVREIETGFMG